MSPAECLEYAHKLLSDPARWTRGFNARTASGQRCSALDPEARKWCLRGALIRACRTADEYEYDVEMLDASERLLHRVVGRHPPDFNDAAEHAEVLKAIEEALAGGGGEENK